MRRYFSGYLTLLNERLRKNTALLESLSPLSVLRRGYSITRKRDENTVIRRAEALAVGENVNIKLAQGSIDAKVQKIFQE
jgi:exodeoxyribonuclease VII large subunit